MARNTLNLAMTTSTTSSPGQLDDGQVQFNILDAPYLDLNFIDTDSLGITYGNAHCEQTNGFASEYTFDNEAYAGLPYRPLFHNNTFPQQPSIHLAEPTPITPHGPPRNFVQIPSSTIHQEQEDTWSPASLVSASSFGQVHSRSHSFSGPTLPTASPQKHLTPQSHHISPMSTPRQEPRTPSPLLSGLQTPELRRSSPTRRHYTPIAPNPNGVQQLNSGKHSYSEEEMDWPSAKRQKSMPPSPTPTVEMSDEDRVLLKLKDEDGLTWRDIQTKFLEDLGKDYQIPALQMRIKRLRDRMRVWTEGDVQALRLAHQHLMETKFEIIASKMLEFGSTEKWTAKQCRQKWQDLVWSSEPGSVQPLLRTSTYPNSYTSSPNYFTNPLGLRMRSASPHPNSC